MQVESRKPPDTAGDVLSYYSCGLVAVTWQSYLRGSFSFFFFFFTGVLSPFQLTIPPEFEVNHIPEGNVVCSKR